MKGPVQSGKLDIGDARGREAKGVGKEQAEWLT